MNLQLDKVIDLVKSIIIFFSGWIIAKKSDKIEKLEEENEKLKKELEIEHNEYIANDVYDRVWQK